MYVRVYVCMSLRLQPHRSTFWHNIPYVNLKTFSQFFEKKYFLPFFYISLRFLCNFKEQLRENQYVILIHFQVLLEVQNWFGVKF